MRRGEGERADGGGLGAYGRVMARGVVGELCELDVDVAPGVRTLCSRHKFGRDRFAPAERLLQRREELFVIPAVRHHAHLLSVPVPPRLPSMFRATSASHSLASLHLGCGNLYKYGAVWPRLDAPLKATVVSGLPHGAPMTSAVRLIRNDQLAQTVDYAYAATAEVPARPVWVAGACPLDSNGEPVALGDYPAKAHHVKRNLVTPLEAAGDSRN